jgi:ADP-heptose:LPS heptosyltransferase
MAMPGSRRIAYNQPMRYPARTILAIDNSPFGASMDLLPAIAAIRQGYADAKIVGAASSGLCELFNSYRLVDHAIDLGAIKPSSHWPGSAVFTELKLASRTQGRDFDLVLTFSGLSIVQLLARFRTRARIIQPSTTLWDLIEPLIGRGYHQSPRRRSPYNSVLRQLGLEANEPPWSPPRLTEQDDQFEKLLRRGGYKGGEPLAMLYSAGPNSPVGWPLDRFSDLAGRLATAFGVRTIAADIPYTSDFTSRIGWMLPKDSIKVKSPRGLELVACLARASMIVTDDSGVARFAARLGTPAIDLADSDPLKPGNLIHQAPGGTLATTDEVFEIACEIVRKSRTAALFDR